jgi:spore germination protein YaaH
VLQKHKSLFFVLLFLGFFAWFLYPKDCSAQGKITAAWCWTEGGTTELYMQQIDASTNLGIVCPTGIYLVDGNGTLVNQIDNRLVTYAHSKGKKVWALFANKNFSKYNAHQVLIDPAKQAKVIREIVDIAVKNNYDGVNIDWENMYVEDRDLFTDFVRQLTASLKDANKTVSVDVTVLTAEWDKPPYSTWVHCYDRAALGKIVDYVALMAYDEHNQAYPNGSVASLPWVEEGIKHLIKDVPSSKVLLGVPFYTHDFSNEYPKGSEYIGLDETQRRLTQYNASVYWDAGVGQYVATYYRNGYKHSIWVEDDRSLGLKLDLANQYNLAGMAAWSLGSEFSSTWDMIGQKMGKTQQPPSSSVTYTIKRGDTLWLISQRYNTTVDAIAKANNLNPNAYIYPGQTISIPEQTPEQPSTPPSSSEPLVYIVQRGDTLWLIAQKYGTTVNALAAANNINPNNYILVGQRLVIPGEKSCETPPVTGNTVYTVQRGDTLWRIAQKYNTTVNAITKANNLNPRAYIYPGQQITIPGQSSTQKLYTVQRGDSLWLIAQKYGTTVANLARLNQINPNNPIYPGQQLKV